MSNSKKKLKFQIKPNSLSPSEESAVKSVMNRFRGRSDSSAPETAQTDNQSLDIQSSVSQISDNNFLDIQIDQPEISDTRQQDIQTETNLDIQTETFRKSEKFIFGNPVSQTLDIQENYSGYPNNETSDIKISKPTLRIAGKPDKPAIKISKEKKSDIQKTQKKSEWKKYETTRSRKGIFLRIDNEIIKKFKQFCIDKELEFSEATEMAWLRFMETLDSRKAEGLDSLIALNNKQLKMMWKTKPVIINLYFAYNRFFSSKLRWSAKDDNNAAVFNDTDPRIVELGILQTQGNLLAEGKSDTSINGFLYYTSEIKRFLMYEDSPEMLDAILKINRENWKKLSGREADLGFLETETK